MNLAIHSSKRLTLLSMANVCSSFVWLWVASHWFCSEIQVDVCACVCVYVFDFRWFIFEFQLGSALHIHFSDFSFSIQVSHNLKPCQLVQT